MIAAQRHPDAEPLGMSRHLLELSAQYVPVDRIPILDLCPAVAGQGSLSKLQQPYPIGGGPRHEITDVAAIGTDIRGDQALGHSDLDRISAHDSTIARWPVAPQSLPRIMPFHPELSQILRRIDLSRTIRRRTASKACYIGRTQGTKITQTIRTRMEKGTPSLMKSPNE